MDETMNLINRLANERLKLYIQAGRQQLNQPQKERVAQITNELAILWDRHRRELADLTWAHTRRGYSARVA